MAGTEFKVEALIGNRYRVLAVIDGGGMGVLYRVSDEARDGQIVALKTVTAETPESLARFQRELRVLTQLHHPNLVNIFDYGTLTEDELYFTME